MATTATMQRPSSLENINIDPNNASQTQLSAGQELPPAEEEKKKKSIGQRFNRVTNKMSGPINRFAGKLGCEAFNPQELDLEIDKAARILRNFCIDGFWAPDDGASTSSGESASQNGDAEGSKKKKKGVHGRDRKALRKIPPELIKNCAGLAIFTSMRFGLHIGGGNGCGILIRHLPDGSWSAPSGIHMANLSTGLVAGLDVYDCVAVINNQKGLDGFTQVRGSIGGEVAATVGPFGLGQIGDISVSKNVTPVFTYTKNRGLYVGAHLDGTMYIERTNENPRFYGKEGIRHKEILSGEIQAPPGTCTRLYQTLNAIEGKQYNPADLPPAYDDVVSGEEELAAANAAARRDEKSAAVAPEFR